MTRHETSLILTAGAFLRIHRQRPPSTFDLGDFIAFLETAVDTRRELTGDERTAIINYFNENAAAVPSMSGFRWR